VSRRIPGVLVFPRLRGGLKQATEMQKKIRVRYLLHLPNVIPAEFLSGNPAFN